MARTTGHDGVVRWIQDRTLQSPTVRIRIERIVALSGERAAAFGRVHVDGRDVSSYALVAIVRDGKIAATRSYLSDEPTMESLGLL